MGVRKIRWIHFSDLHLGNDSAVDTRLMRRKLPGYIAGLNQTFDYAFCSGDIKEWNSDDSMAPDYIRKLCDASHTPLDHLFIVPGNHDIKIGGDDRQELIKNITSWETDYYRSNDGRISDKVQTVNCFDSLQVAILGKPPERKKSPIQESKIGDSSEGSYSQRL
jgi:hypothetical protein